MCWSFSHAQLTCKLREYQRQMMDSLVQQLEKKQTKANWWSSLAEQTLAKVTIFNKRRGG